MFLPPGTSSGAMGPTASERDRPVHERQSLRLRLLCCREGRKRMLRRAAFTIVPRVAATQAAGRCIRSPGGRHASRSSAAASRPLHRRHKR